MGVFFLSLSAHRIGVFSHGQTETDMIGNTTALNNTVKNQAREIQQMRDILVRLREDMKAGNATDARQKLEEFLSIRNL